MPFEVYPQIVPRESPNCVACYSSRISTEGHIVRASSHEGGSMFKLVEQGETTLQLGYQPGRLLAVELEVVRLCFKASLQRICYLGHERWCCVQLEVQVAT
jgi:hypothetical protein